MTVIAIALGTASIVSVLGLAQAGAYQVSNRLSALQSLTIAVSLPEEAWSEHETTLLDRLGDLAQITGAGIFIESTSKNGSIEVRDALHATESRTYPLIIATPAGLATRGVEFAAGGMLSTEMSEMQLDTVVLGVAVARDLEVDFQNLPVNIELAGRRFTVTGIAADGDASSLVSAGIVASPATAKYLEMLPKRPVLLVGVVAGAGEFAGTHIPALLWPEDSGSVSVGVAPSADELRGLIEGDTSVLLWVMTFVVMLAATFSIMATMQVAVWQRRNEIGIKRALGMTRQAIGLEFLLESATLGLVGGMAGLVLGALAVASVVFATQWTLILPVGVLSAPILGLLVGSLAGLIPASAAAKVDPIILLRS